MQFSLTFTAGETSSTSSSLNLSYRVTQRFCVYFYLISSHQCPSDSLMEEKHFEVVMNATSCRCNFLQISRCRPPKSDASE